MDRKKSSKLFLGIFDALAVGSVAAFIGTTVPEMDFSYNRSYWAIAAFICFIIGIFSFFAMMHVQVLYPTLDYHVEDNKQVLDDTKKNRKFFKLMNIFKYIGVAGILIGVLAYVLTQVIFGVN